MFGFRHFTVLCRCAAEVLAETLVEITGIVKADRNGQFRNGNRLFDIPLNDVGGFQDAVVHQIFKRRHVDGPVEEAAAFAFGYMNGIGDIFQGNGLFIILLNEEYCVFDAVFIRGKRFFGIGGCGNFLGCGEGYLG